MEFSEMLTLNFLQRELERLSINRTYFRLLVAYKNMLRAVEDRCISTIYSLVLINKGNLSFTSLASLKRHDTLARDYLRSSYHFSEIFLENKSLPMVPPE